MPINNQNKSNKIKKIFRTFIVYRTLLTTNILNLKMFLKLKFLKFASKVEIISDW